MQFKTFKSRLSVFFITLLSLVLLATYVIVNQRNIENAKQTIQDDLEVTAQAFTELLHSRSESLFDIVRPATSDFAFSRAYTEGHKPTLVSAMDNIISRIVHVAPDTMLIVDLEGKLIASTRDNVSTDAWQTLIAEAENNEYLEASHIQVYQNQAYEFIITPLLLPDPVAWVIVGFPIDKSFTQDVKNITGRDLSVLLASTDNNTPNLVSVSSHDPDTVDIINSQLLNEEYISNIETINQISGERFVSLLKPLSKTSTDIHKPSVSILLQGSFDQAIKPYERLNKILGLVFLGSLIASLLMILGLAKSISRPLETLTNTVRSIRDGNYSAATSLNRQDEIGVLSESVNHMAKGLQEKEQVRDLLGKVVSDEIANELLSKDLELGGIEKPVTIIFSDIKNFTDLCEGIEPAEILSRLNRYFNITAEAIEQHGGVVDKYIGDAIMGLFGTPIEHPDAAQRAVNAALMMTDGLEKLNREFQSEGIAKLGMGIGINTGKVVVGNMGSQNRMNYTVIGDHVNIASRFVGLSKEYQVQTVISEQTAKQCPDFYCREIDLVKVKGKKLPVKIFTPLCKKIEFDDSRTKTEQDFEKALVAYRQQQWDQAIDLFNDIVSSDPFPGLVKVYLYRCQQYRLDPPSKNWDSAYTFTSK